MSDAAEFDVAENKADKKALAQDVHEQNESRAQIDRARLSRVFGDVLPETTRDERGSPPGTADGMPEEWMKEQRPPHYE